MPNTKLITFRRQKQSRLGDRVFSITENENRKKNLQWTENRRWRLTPVSGSPESLNNISFKVADAINIGKYFEPESFDFILSDRCLINLETSKNQYDAIRQISSLIKPRGYYIAIENFTEGQNNLNEARKKMGLNEIPVRWHNLFFNEVEFVKNVSQLFMLILMALYLFDYNYCLSLY